MNIEIYLETISYNNITLNFKKPYRIDICKDSKYHTYYCDIPELNIYAAGITEDETLEDIKENLIIDWKTYVKCDIEELSQGAIKLRKKLLELLEEEK